MKKKRKETVSMSRNNLMEPNDALSAQQPPATDQKSVEEDPLKNKDMFSEDKWGTSEDEAISW